VEAAFKLFTENGFYATGVDLIMHESKVSKRTMYVYFPTKNDLIVAVLEFYRADYERKFNDVRTQQHAGHALCHLLDTRLDFDSARALDRFDADIPL
jgi:AcrR family transcriptional regulator